MKTSRHPRRQVPVTEGSPPNDNKPEQPPDDPAPIGATTEADGEDPTAGLQADLDRFRDLALRSQADFDNFKKRAAREKEDAVKYANSSLLQRLVSILDNFELGLTAARTEGEHSPIYSGMVLVQKQLNDLLEENGLQAIEAENKKVDPNLHEAIAHESSETPEGTVIRQARRGYRFKDRLLRPARVIVSSGPAK